MKRLVHDRLADGTASLHEDVDGFVARNVASTEMHLGDGPVVALEESNQHLGEIDARLAIDPAHDAEIDHDKAAVPVDEQVSRMHVRMKKAVAENLDEERLRRARHDLVRIVAGGD